MKTSINNSKSKRLFSFLLTIIFILSLLSIPISADTAYPIYNQYIDSVITRISVCSDLHLDEVAQNRGKFASYLAAVDTFDPQMLIFCGDPCTSGYNAPQPTDYGGIFTGTTFANVYDEVRAAVAYYVGADKPVVFVAGNHEYDVNPSPYFTSSGFDSYYGLVPTENFDIFLMGAQNNMNWTFSSAQMTALEEYLDSRADSDKLLLVPAHFPIDDAGGRGDATNAAELKALLSAYDLPIVYMWGHNHSEADKPYSDMARIIKEYPISYTTVNAGAIGYRAPADTNAWQGLNLTVDLVNNQLNYSVIGNSSEGSFRVVGTHTQALPTSGPYENAQEPLIQTQPGNTNVTIGAPVSLSVAATVGRGTLSYQWFVNTLNANSGGTIIPGAVVASYSPPTNVLGQTWYYCEITNTDDTATVNQTAVIASQAASVQVQAAQQTGWDGTIASSYGGGSGTAGDPWLITNAAELARLAQETNNGTNYSGAYFRQTADIDLEDRAWTPIGGYISNSSGSNRVFAGTYDGGGKTIRGLHIDLTAEGSSSLPKTYGLFGYVSGTIMNVGVVGADVSFVNTQTGSSNTNAYVGIIAGYLGNNGTPAAKILNSFASGSAYASTASDETTVLCCAGGITGYVYSGEIRNSYASATASIGGNYSSQYSGYGGIVGQIRSGDTFANVSWNNELTAYGAAGSSSAVTGLAGKTSATLKATDFVDTLNDGAAGNTGWLEWMADTAGALNGGYPLHLRQEIVIVDALVPVIQTQPVALSVAPDGAASLSVVATVDRGVLSYQWYSNSVDSNTGGLLIPDASTATYSPPTDTLGQIWYYCVITNTDIEAEGNTTASATSSTAYVKVSEAPAVWDGSIASSYGGGSGTEAEPWLITNAAELARLAQQTNAGTDYSGKYFRQTADIDLGDLAWTPIGGYVSSAAASSNRTFAGTYDGGGKLVRGLKIDITALGSTSLIKSYGLFGHVSGTIMNLGVVDADVSFVNTKNTSSETNAYVGLIAGYLSSDSSPAAKILNSFATGNASASTSLNSSGVLCCAGGLTGYVYGGEIRNSYASAAVTISGSYSASSSGYGGVFGQSRSRSGVPNVYENTSWNNELTTYGAAGNSSAVTGLNGKTSAALKVTDFVDDLNDGAAGQTGWLEWMADTAGTLNGGYPLHLRQEIVFVDAQVPVIQTQPVSLSVAPDGAASLSVVATVDRGVLSYQWYSNLVDSNTGGLLIPDASTATYSPPTDALGQIWYYCVITNTDMEAEGNTTASATSSTAYVTVSEAPPVWDGTIAESYGGGSGTEADPWLITNAAELARLAQQTNAGTDYSGKYFRQTADIDLGDLAWTPIGGYISSSSSGNRTFSGTYDGDGNLVRGLKIDLTAEGSSSMFKSYALFGHVSGTLKNLGVVDADVSFVNTQSGNSNTNAYVGIIVGYLQDGDASAARILNCFATGNAYAKTNSSIAYCCAGGLTGYVNVGEISNSYASITASIGGTYSNGDSGYGGAIGKIRNNTTYTLDDVYWNSELTTYGASGSSSAVSGLTGMTSVALKATDFVDELNDGAAGNIGWLEWMADTAGTLNSGYPLHLRQEIVITPISGIVGISGAARYGSSVTAVVSGVDPAAARPALNYTWLRDGNAISGATSSSYTIAAADIGHDISVRVSGTGDYSGELTSAAVTAHKAVTTAPAAPTLSSASTDTITLNAVAGREYRIGTDGDWQTSGIFSGLTADTSYDFFARIAETSTHEASPASAALTASTEALITPISGVVGIGGIARYGSSITAVVSGVDPAAARPGLNYTWLRDGNAISGATSSSYTIAAADIGHDISVRVSGTGDYSGELTSAAVTAHKAVTTAPTAPTLASASIDTITLNTVAGREYRIGTDGDWQTSGIFSGLAADTSYDFFARIAETSTHEASPASAALTASTEALITPITQISGTVGISGAARFGSELTANVESVIPVAARSSLHYIWLRNGRIIPGAYTSSYIINTADIGKYISVIVIAGEGYSGTLISSPVRAEKAVASSPAAPTLKSATNNKVTLIKVEGQQYRLGSGPWQNSAVFTGLRPDTSYQFYTRKAETNTTMASAPSEPAAFKTTGTKPDPKPPQPPFIIRVVYLPVRIGFYYIYIPYVVIDRNSLFWGY